MPPIPTRCTLTDIVFTSCIIIMFIFIEFYIEFYIFIEFYFTNLCSSVNGWGAVGTWHNNLQTALKDDFQSALRSLMQNLMFIKIINGSLDGMLIDLIR